MSLYGEKRRRIKSLIKVAENAKYEYDNPCERK